MRCTVCHGHFGSASVNINDDRRVETPRGPVHVRCLAYVVIDLGLERAFGALSARDRAIAISKLKLPTVDDDQRDGVTRYRKVGEMGRDLGLHPPQFTPQLTRLIDSVQKRSAVVGQEAQRIAEAQDHLRNAAKLLDALAS